MSFPLASIAAPDFSQPAEMLGDRRTYVVRARVPFAFSASLTDARIERAEPMVDDEAEEGPTDPTNPGEQKIVKAEGDPMVDEKQVEGEGVEGDDEEVEGDEDEVEVDAADDEGDGMGTMSGPVLYGIASSTGIDTHGTEMSRRALDGMAAQCSTGNLAYLPSHPSYSGTGGEWDSVIGYVVKGEVVSAQVEKAATDMEPAFALRVMVALDPHEPMAEKLAGMIERKRKIGQSIGGWFTELRYVYAPNAGEYDPPERVIIEGVELDHLAATRRPSNTDSWIDGMRSAVAVSHDSAVLRAKAARSATVVVEANDRNTSVPLDTGTAPRHDSPDDAGREGRRASPGAKGSVTATLTNTEELQMTPEALRAVLDSALAPIAARLDAVEARTAVATPPGARVADPVSPPAAESAEVVALRARLAASEARTAATYFGRKGHAGAGSFDRSVVEGVAESVVEQSPALAAVVRSRGFIDRRSVSHMGSTMDEQVAMRASLESDLNALINSAVDEGVIREPDADVGSWS